MVLNLSPAGFVRIKAGLEWEKGIPSESFRRFLFSERKFGGPEEGGNKNHINTSNIYCYYIGNMMK